MNLFKIHLILFLLFFLSLSAQTQTEKLLQNSQSKFLNYSKETSFCDFIDYVDFLYNKYENKTVTVKTDCRFPIGIDLNNVSYPNALKYVCSNNDMEITTTQNEIIISKNRKETLTENNKLEALLNSKQVKITAVLFEANIDKMKENGVDWNFALSKSGMRGNGGFQSRGSNRGNVKISIAGDFYKFSGFTSALFKFFESKNLGKIISKMSVTVRDGKVGKMQVGTDFSIKQLDFAGNVTDAFFPTGTIINVLPKVYSKDSLNFTSVKIKVERSIPQPGEISSIVKKTLTDTEVLLRNNEEAVIGSLLLEEHRTIREGIPVLKDLPWWVLGLRYLTGYDSKTTQHKEVVMLMKAEIIPALSDKIFDKNLIDETLHFQSNEVEKLNNKMNTNDEIK